VFIGEILDNVTQVSDVAPGPLVFIRSYHTIVDEVQYLQYLNNKHMLCAREKSRELFIYIK
jgi:hypothetical protein